MQTLFEIAACQSWTTDLLKMKAISGKVEVDNSSLGYFYNFVSIS